MSHRRKVRSRAVVVVVVALLSWLLMAAAAQPIGDTARRAPRVPAPLPSDFMRGRPRVYVGFDTGFLFAHTGTDLYDFITDQLTLDKKAFSTPVLGGRFGVAVTPRIDVVVGLEFSQSEKGSEQRGFVDHQLQPITQTTSREEYSLTASVRFALLPSGRRISRFAWIPRALTPQVSAGAGATKYEFQQHGSFVDFATRRVFNDAFNSKGERRGARVGRRRPAHSPPARSHEGRPLHVEQGHVSEDFVDFAPLDLVGFRLGGGMRVTF